MRVFHTVVLPHPAGPRTMALWNKAKDTDGGEQDASRLNRTEEFDGWILLFEPRGVARWRKERYQPELPVGCEEPRLPHTFGTQSASQVRLVHASYTRALERTKQPPLLGTGNRASWSCVARRTWTIGRPHLPRRPPFACPLTCAAHPISPGAARSSLRSWDRVGERAPRRIPWHRYPIDPRSPVRVAEISSAIRSLRFNVAWLVFRRHLKAHR